MQGKMPAFFKVLSTMDFTHLLRLPPFFFQKYGLNLPENVQLRIRTGKTWDVKVEQIENGLFCFTRGWKDFAKDVELKLGEFLVFMLDGKSLFDVTVYDNSACEREFRARNFQVEDSNLDEDECETKNQNACDVIKRRGSKARDDGGASKLKDLSLEESNPLYFETLLKLHHRSRVTLPVKFWMAAGLQEKETVGLEFVPTHNYQSVALTNIFRHLSDGKRMDMAKGWPEFRKANGLVFGKMYSFEFKPSKNIIQVNEVKE